MNPRGRKETKDLVSKGVGAEARAGRVQALGRLETKAVLMGMRFSGLSSKVWLPEPLNP